MTVKRLVLSILTLVVVLLVGSSLLGSLGKPQITNRLQLYQTNLVLTATAEPTDIDPSALQAQVRQAIVGQDPLKTALEQYEAVRKTATTDLATFQTSAASAATSAAAVAPNPELAILIQQQQQLIQQLDLQIGLLQAEQGDVAAAQTTWAQLLADEPLATPGGTILVNPGVVQTATLLQGLWLDPPRLGADGEAQLRAGLDGWFEGAALQRWYTVTGETAALEALQAQQGAIAQRTLLKLTVIGILPGIAAVTGIGFIIFLLAQRVMRGKEALLTLATDAPWETPWDWEIIWQVLIVGFFFMGQIVVPFVLGTLGSAFLVGGSSRSRAIYTLIYYLLMATAGLLVLFFSVRPYRPLAAPWFRYRPVASFLLWGIGGYLTALPLMLGVSLLNQQFWQGQGGSNPLLQIVLEENDPVALGLFLFTAAVAAPIFEETLFRGFLLPSLTRYMPAAGAIALSSLVFAIAHLSLSEVLPLTVLGSMLGFVYWRSRNLLAPILLHSLWNSVTMIGLFILGSGH